MSSVFPFSKIYSWMVRPTSIYQAQLLTCEKVTQSLHPCEITSVYSCLPLPALPLLPFPSDLVYRAHTLGDTSKWPRRKRTKTDISSQFQKSMLTPTSSQIAALVLLSSFASSVVPSTLWTKQQNKSWVNRGVLVLV